MLNTNYCDSRNVNYRFNCFVSSFNCFLSSCASFCALCYSLQYSFVVKGPCASLFPRYLHACSFCVSVFLWSLLLSWTLSNWTLASYSSKCCASNLLPIKLRYNSFHLTWSANRKHESTMSTIYGALFHRIPCTLEVNFLLLLSKTLSYIYTRKGKGNFTISLYYYIDLYYSSY